MIVAGIGCQKGATGQQIAAAIRRSLSQYAAAEPDLGLILTGVIKGQEAGLREAASQFGVPFMIVDDGRLKSASDKCLTTSQASIDATGLPSLSEAAAIIGAGPGGRLLGPRIVVDGVTCALAATGGPIR